MLVTTIDNAHQFEQLFREYGREDHFSYEGFKALYDYLEEFSECIGENYKIDVIALCCDFTEYESWEKIYNDYSYSYNNESKTFEELEEEDELDDFKEWVQDRTTVIECTDYEDNVVGIIIQCF